MAGKIRIYWTDQDDPSEGSLCTPADPLAYAPNFDDLINPQVITEHDQYGLLGFTEIRDWTAPYSQLNWTLCLFLDYFDGPFTEAIPTDGSPCYRFNYRWSVFYNKIEGSFRYSRVGTPSQPADPLLFPAPVFIPQDGQISGSFDANARMCYAFDFNATDVQIRRFVAGVPTTYQFAGQHPKLLFDGLIQRDNALTDLCCFYVRGGDIYVRMQRDNFGVEYLMVDNGLHNLVRITKTDRVGDTQILYTLDNVDTKQAIQSAPYPPWPVCEGDEQQNVFLFTGGSYDEGIVLGGNYYDFASNALEFPGGVYFSTVVNETAAPDFAANALQFTGGIYFLTVVNSTAGPDYQANTLVFTGGVYFLVVVNGGSYNEPQSNTLQFTGGTYA